MRFLLGFLFCLIGLVSAAQRSESIYGSEDRALDYQKIKSRFGNVHLSKDNLEEAKLIAFIRGELFDGDPVKDSIRSLRIREAYYYNSNDDVNSIYMHLRLLMMYNGYLTESELEEVNRKIAEKFLNFRNYTVAIDFFKESLNYASKGSENAYSCSQVGTCYRNMMELDSMIVWFERSADYSILTGGHYTQYINSMGYVYSLVGDYEKSEYFYKKGFESFRRSKVLIDSIQYYILRSNWASLQSNKGNQKEALRILKTIVSNYVNFSQVPWFQREVYHKIAKVEIELGHCKEALDNFRIVDEIFKDDKVNRDYLKHLELKSNALEICGGDSQLMGLYKEYLSVKKELEAFESKRADFLELIQKRVYEDQIALTANNLALKEESRAVLEVSNGRLKRLMWISSLSFIMIFSFGIVQYRSRKKRQLRKESHLKLKQELVEEQGRRQSLQRKIDEQEIENKRLELSGMLNSIDRKSTLTSEIVKRLEGIKSKVEREAKDDLGALLQFIRSQNNLTNIEELLNRNVDVLGGDFKVRLTSKFPNLTTSELQLIIYLRLGLPTKEIAQIKNVEPSSVRIFKHRLKTKLGISKEVDLVRFIGEL